MSTKGGGKLEAVPAVNAVEAKMAEMELMLAKLTAENAALKARPVRGLSLKISEKKALSVYGLGRFPITLYKGQWARLLGAVGEIEEFLKAHDGELATKPEGAPTPVAGV